jgi:oligoendopeptidase F
MSNTMFKPRFSVRPLATGMSLALMALLGIAPLQAAAAPGAPRVQAPLTSDAVRWDLTALYATPEAWAASLQKASEQARGLAALKPRLTQDAAGMYASLAAISDANREAARLMVYAVLRADEDLNDARAQERRQQSSQLWALIAQATAWVAPSLVALGPEKVQQFMADEPELRARFDHYLAEALRGAPHTLSPEGEALLAAAGPVLDQPARLHQQLGDAELVHGRTVLSTGARITLTPSAYERHRSSAVRADRKRVFDGFFAAYKKAEGSFGANLTTQVLGNVFMARSRRHPDALSAALFADAMPSTVYRTLVEQAHAGLPTLHRYLRLRQRMLAITGTLAYYDNYPPLVKVPPGQRWTLARSKAVTLQALAPLGPTYGGLLATALNSPWVDSHPRPGKSSGAYMFGSAYDVHPYMLLNHNDDYESLSTLAHEAGHVVHTLLANASQPFDKSDYSTFIAESASIANEMLLSDHLLAQARSPAEKLFYLSQALESIRTTFFRQVMFAEFQLKLHEEVEAGRPLSGERLTQLYCGLARQYYGEAEGVMKIDPAYCVEWAYIDHFYKGFYVWQYATSMVGAAEFTQALQRESAAAAATAAAKPSARERFITLLQAGGSRSPYPLYLAAGVDLAQPAPYQALMARMNRLLDEFERTAGLAGTPNPSASARAVAAPPGRKRLPATPAGPTRL